MTPVPVDTVETAVQAAGHAPSLHNSQPWRWVFDGDRLDLFAVPDRMLPTTDPTGRQMFLSCGIALGHLRTALAAEGWHIVVERCPDPNRYTHAATVGFIPHPAVTAAERERVLAIRRRHTDRLPLLPPAGWDDVETVLRSTFDPADAMLDVVPESARPILAHASELTAALRYRDAEYQAELGWWTGTSGPDIGIPRSALVTSAERAHVPIGRDFPVTHQQPRRDPLTDQAIVLVLSTGSDDRGEVLGCGEALSTILLECTVNGFATCVLTHLTEYSRSRDVVGELIGHRARPQALVRVGIAPEGPEPVRTPRLPLREILHIAR